MKHIIILLFLTIYSTSYSQNWKLNTVNKTKEYGFEYWFSFQNEDDKNEFGITEKINGKKSEIIGEILDKKCNPISGANIKIISENGDIIKNLQANFNGKFTAELKKGNYSIKTNYYGFDNFETDFSVKEKSSTELKIKLGLGAELQIYQIESKNKLTENKILDIIKCVEQKRNFKKFNTRKCSEKLNYKVSIQI